MKEFSNVVKFFTIIAIYQVGEVLSQNGVQIKQLQSGRCLTVDNNPIRSIFTNFKPAIISSNCAPPLNALSLWQFNFTGNSITVSGDDYPTYQITPTTMSAHCADAVGTTFLHTAMYIADSCGSTNIVPYFYTKHSTTNCGYFQIVNQGSGLCVDLILVSANTVFLNYCNNGNTQLFTALPY